MGNNQKAAAVIAAFNEEATIGAVVGAIKQSTEISEVIVVNDGSTDGTARAAREAGARVIDQKNQGKGAAMRNGVRATDAAIIFFADADLLNLRLEHVSSLVKPVLEGEAAMAIGLRDRYGFLMDLMPRIDPLLAISGERAVRREIFEALPESLTRGFAIETTLNDYCRKKNLKVRLIKMRGVSQVIKEKKRGLIPGFIARLRMMGRITSVRIALLFKKW